MSRRVSSFYGLICLWDLSSGFLEEDSHCRKMSHGVSSFCRKFLLLDMSFVFASILCGMFQEVFSFHCQVLISEVVFKFCLQYLSSVFIFHAFLSKLVSTIAECLAGFPHSVARFVFRKCRPGLSFERTWDEKVTLMKKNVPWPALGFFGTSWW